MLFTFYDQNDKALFIRDDAEQAEWTVHEMSLSLAFPYRADKIIERGMRVGFTDPAMGLQVFEIRKVKTYEPDHYQEITAEHIMIAEFTDAHVYYPYEIGNANTAQTALQLMLNNVNPYTVEGSDQVLHNILPWQIGTVSIDGFQNAIVFDYGSLMQTIPLIEDAYNVRITPRLTSDATGITGRYLDITMVGGTYHGMRLSMDKNVFDASVQIDDTDLVTAMYAYGKDKTTLRDAVWTETADHPAKRRGQWYLEDAAATALYGRNGKPRFGFYQNADVYSGPYHTDLLEKTWEMLKQKRNPTITVDCAVEDLYRLGYADEPIVLHDKVYFEMRPVGAVYELEITSLIVDLLNPMQTNITIGTVYPNIIKINHDTSMQARGQSGGGSGNSSGKTKTENVITEINATISGVETVTIHAGSIKDGDGNTQNVVTWS